jgi:hypothetical protein
MSEFDGDLLIGGLRLKQLHGELDQDLPQDGSADRLFAGRFRLHGEQQDLLEAGRRYRLHLADGRSGPVVVSRIRTDQGEAVVVEFTAASAELAHA